MNRHRIAVNRICFHLSHASRDHFYVFEWQQFWTVWLDVYVKWLWSHIKKIFSSSASLYHKASSHNCLYIPILGQKMPYFLEITGKNKKPPVTWNKAYWWSAVTGGNNIHTLLQFFEIPYFFKVWNQHFATPYFFQLFRPGINPAKATYSSSSPKWTIFPTSSGGLHGPAQLFYINCWHGYICDSRKRGQMPRKGDILHKNGFMQHVTSYIKLHQ